MARGYCQCLSRCLCITVPPVFRHHVFLPHVFRHHVFLPHVFHHHVFPPHVFRHHVFSPTYSVTTYLDLHPATTMTTETDDLLHDTTCFWSATDYNRIILIIYQARPLTYCGRDIWNCSKVNFLFELAVEASRRIIILYRR